MSGASGPAATPMLTAEVRGDAILALNAGSSGMKFALYEVSGGPPELILRGEIEEGASTTRMKASDADGASLADEDWSSVDPDAAALPTRVIDWVEARECVRGLSAVGHRIVHGGVGFRSPTTIDEDVMARMRALEPLAPLHQSRCLAPVAALEQARPGLPQVACFDTAFHAEIAPPASRYAVPRWLEAEGVRRYGFHGLSYQHVADLLPEVLPGRSRVVAAHLGNGASLCALLDGRSVDTTMGFSVLDGLMMGTRPGILDPGVVLFLLKERGLSVETVEDLLYHQCGLRGVSGFSSDLRVLEASGAPSAVEAIDLFAFMAARQIAAMATTLQGLDAIVFTGGIGERSAHVRGLICERLAWLGVIMDPVANQAGAMVLDAKESRVAIRRVVADEEIVIAVQTAELLRKSLR